MKEFDYEKYVDYLIKYLKTKDKKYLVYATKFKNKTIPNNLFKYYSLAKDYKLNNKKLACLENEEIYCPLITELNDPFEGKNLILDEDKQKKYNISNNSLKVFLEVFEEILRCTSFTANSFQSMPMWANYANNHRGYCVEYEIDENIKDDFYIITYAFKRINHPEIIYSYMASCCNENVYMENYTKKLMFLSLIVKHISWLYENEYKYLKFTEDKKIKLKAKNIYVGYNCSAIYKKRIIEISKKINCNVYLMKNELINDSFDLKVVKVS